MTKAPDPVTETTIYDSLGGEVFVHAFNDTAVTIGFGSAEGDTWSLISRASAVLLAHRLLEAAGHPTPNGGMTAAPADGSNVPASATARGGRGQYTRQPVSPASAAAGRVARVCFRETHAAISFWANANEVQQQTMPCEAACRGSHSLVVHRAGHLHVKGLPVPTVLVAPVVPGCSRIVPGHLKLVQCPHCGGEHQHPLRHIGTVRAAACLGGFYRITKGNNADE